MNKLLGKLTVLLLVFGLVFMSCDEPGGSGGRNLLNGLDGESIVPNLDSSLGPTETPVNSNEGVEGYSNGEEPEAEPPEEESIEPEEEVELPQSQVCPDCGNDPCDCCFWCEGDGKVVDGECNNEDCITNDDEKKIDVIVTKDPSDSVDRPNIDDIIQALTAGNVIEFTGASFNSGKREYHVGKDLIFTVTCGQFDGNTKKVEIKVEIDLPVKIEAFGGGFSGKNNVETLGKPGDTITFYSNPSGALNFRVRAAD